MSGNMNADRPPIESKEVDLSLALNRRETMVLGAATAAALTTWPRGGAFAQSPALEAPVVSPIHHQVATRINGETVRLAIDPRMSLLDMLREELGLTGTKKGCDHGQCGACTVHLDGKRVASCLTLAAKADGHEVTTIEAISGPDGGLHPMQQAFIDHDALQCGYCTPGQIMAAIACVHEGHAASVESIREYMSGNICRCGAYVGIVAAIQDAAGKMERS